MYLSYRSCINKFGLPPSANYPVNRNVNDEVSSFGIGFKGMHISFMTFKMTFTLTKYFETSFSHDRHFPFSVRNGLTHSAPYLILSYLILSYLSRSLADLWGTTVDFTTSFLHFSRFPAFRSMIFHSSPVHSLMLSSYRFLCLPLRRKRWEDNIKEWTAPRTR